MIIDGKKTCFKCGESKVAEEGFYRDDSKKDGYQSRCKECTSAVMKARRATPEGKAVDKKYKQSPERKAAHKKYQQSPKGRAARNDYVKRRLAEDPRFRAQQNFMRSLRNARKKGDFPKNSSSAEILGCAWEEFMEHLAKQFWPGMTRENQGEGGWEMDHIIPQATIKTEEDFKKLNHYTNFQPLWADDNAKKKANPDYDLTKSLHPLPSWLKEAA